MARSSLSLSWHLWTIQGTSTKMGIFSALRQDPVNLFYAFVDRSKHTDKSKYHCHLHAEQIFNSLANPSVSFLNICGLQRHTIKNGYSFSSLAKYSLSFLCICGPFQAHGQKRVSLPSARWTDFPLSGKIQSFFSLSVIFTHPQKRQVFLFFWIDIWSVILAKIWWSLLVSKSSREFYTFLGLGEIIRISFVIIAWIYFSFKLFTYLQSYMTPNQIAQKSETGVRTRFRWRPSLALYLLRHRDFLPVIFKLVVLFYCFYWEL